MMYSALFRIGVICIPGLAFATELTKSENPVKGHYIVTLDDERRKLSSSSLENLIHKIIQGPDDGIGAQSHGTVDQVYDSVFPGFAADLDEAGLLNVLENEHVVSVEEDGYVQLDQVTWGLDRIDDKDLPLDKSYEPTFGNDGEGVTAYIIDTGILHTHTEFEGRATQAFNSAGGSNVDCNGHGTHVAGTVGAKTYGVANKAKLVGVKVLSCSGSGTYAGVIAGINWVAQNAKKPATANMSLGGGKSTSVNAAVKALVASGVSTVVAAGNSNQDACLYSPASEPDAITVGSTTNTDARSSFSNYGQCVDIFAPGSSITAPWIGSNTALKTISGTSMASPHVCGGVALYLGQNPDLTPTGILNKMLEDSIANTITNVGTGSPNKFLYVGGSHSPTVSPAPTPSPTKPALSKFDFHPFLDSNGGDIGKLNGGVEYYAKVCSSTRACLGFNSNGWFKDVLKPKSEWDRWTNNPKLGFYTKKSKGGDETKPPTKPALSKFDFHPFLDSNGGDIGKLNGGVEYYAKVCSSTRACLGFNSNGWFKDVLKPKSEWGRWTNNPKLGFYTKKSKGGDETKPLSPASTPTNSCDGENKVQCKKLKEFCVFGKNKIPGNCEPKKSQYKEDCGEFDAKDTCDNDSGGNCMWDGEECTHKCDGLAKKACKQVKNSDDKKKMCKVKMLSNPCKGCQSKTTCG